MTSSVSPLSIDTQMADLMQLGDRFTNLRVLGYGGSGLVMSADDQRTNTRVAIKRITFSERCTAKRALREIRLMRKLCHDNVVKIRDILSANCGDLDVSQIANGTVELKQLCIVEEILDTDLHQIIRAKLLTPSYAKLFLYQLLRGLKYIHSANVIHRDLKPSNILVDCQQLTVKISDFGLCRVLDPGYDHTGYLTERVGTCWYLSPEQIVTPRDYCKSVDMWSVGCVFAEMLLGRPVFTGANELNQMLLILDSIHLEEEDWCKVLRVMPNKLLKNHPFRPRTPLAERFTDIQPQALDLLEKLLTFDPSQRVTTEEALAHAYLAEYCGNEPRAQRPLSVEYEAEPISPRAVQRLIIQEANEPNPVTCGSIYTPPVSPTCSLELNTSSTSVGSTDERHDTHTLGEILQIDEETDVTHLGNSTGSSGSSSVEDLNIKNLRNSQDNLHAGSSAHDIISVSHPQLSDLNSDCSREAARHTSDTCLIHGSGSSDVTQCSMVYASQSEHTQNVKLKASCKNSEDEKEIAEPSPQKIVEDKELERNFVVITDKDKGKRAEVGEGQSQAAKQQLYVQLTTDMTENFKEFSQISPKEKSSSKTETPPRSPQGQGDVIRSYNNGARSRTSNIGHVVNDESAKERKLLEFENECYSKFEAEIQENEKNKKRRSARNRNNQSSDLDEMYRLPTEHLRIDRDYSNERIKHKRLTKVQRHVGQYLALYRDEINELNERLKEASLDGAVGGVEEAHDVIHASQEQTNHITVSNISICAPSGDSRRRELDVVNNQRVAGAVGRQRQADGFSSPEENPSSPRASFSAGARPKKSPRKQKAL